MDLYFRPQRPYYLDMQNELDECGTESNACAADVAEMLYGMSVDAADIGGEDLVILIESLEHEYSEMEIMQALRLITESM